MCAVGATCAQAQITKNQTRTSRQGSAATVLPSSSVEQTQLQKVVKTCQTYQYFPSMIVLLMAVLLLRLHVVTMSEMTHVPLSISNSAGYLTETSIKILYHQVTNCKKNRMRHEQNSLCISTLAGKGREGERERERERETDRQTEREREREGEGEGEGEREGYPRQVAHAQRRPVRLADKTGPAKTFSKVSVHLVSYSNSTATSSENKFGRGSRP